MEDELKTSVNVEVELLPSSGGVFEVTADGSLLFSKKDLKRFPVEGEILELVRRAGAAGR